MEAANRALDRAGSYPNDDAATAAARILLAFAEILDENEPQVGSAIPVEVQAEIDADLAMLDDLRAQGRFL